MGARLWRGVGWCGLVLIGGRGAGGLGEVGQRPDTDKQRDRYWIVNGVCLVDITWFKKGVRGNGPQCLNDRSSFYSNISYKYLPYSP